MGASHRQVARLATRWHEVPLGFPGGVAERSESFKMMIAGGNHTVIKKLLSVARLMRGGERLKSPQQYVEWGKLKQIPFIQLHS